MYSLREIKSVPTGIVFGSLQEVFDGRPPLVLFGIQVEAQVVGPLAFEVAQVAGESSLLATLVLEVSPDIALELVTLVTPHATVYAVVLHVII